jgi:hypothetical protein
MANLRLPFLLVLLLFTDNTPCFEVTAFFNVSRRSLRFTSARELKVRWWNNVKYKYQSAMCHVKWSTWNNIDLKFAWIKCANLCFIYSYIICNVSCGAHIKNYVFAQYLHKILRKIICTSAHWRPQKNGQENQNCSFSFNMSNAVKNFQSNLESNNLNNVFLEVIKTFFL